MDSKFFVMAKKPMSSSLKGKIAEAAITFRLVLQGFSVFRSISDGEKFDWVIYIPETKQTLKIQGKATRQGKWGKPVIRLLCADGRGKSRKYVEGEFDFIVGYDLKADTCYVFSFEETKNYKDSITVSENSLENWDKLKTYGI